MHRLYPEQQMGDFCGSLRGRLLHIEIGPSSVLVGLVPTASLPAMARNISERVIRALSTTYSNLQAMMSPSR